MPPKTPNGKAGGPDKGKKASSRRKGLVWDVQSGAFKTIMLSGVARAQKSTRS